MSPKEKGACRWKRGERGVPWVIVLFVMASAGGKREKTSALRPVLLTQAWVVWHSKPD